MEDIDYVMTMILKPNMDMPSFLESIGDFPKMFVRIPGIDFIEVENENSFGFVFYN